MPSALVDISAAHMNDHVHYRCSRRSQRTPESIIARRMEPRDCLVRILPSSLVESGAQDPLRHLFRPLRHDLEARRARHFAQDALGMRALGRKGLADGASSRFLGVQQDSFQRHVLEKVRRLHALLADVEVALYACGICAMAHALQAPMKISTAALHCKEDILNHRGDFRSNATGHHVVRVDVAGVARLQRQAAEGIAAEEVGVGQLPWFVTGLSRRAGVK
mmetsp:Transcript_15438/g.58699  ORF Transcript_15438/g.58699 Transcript_15438/m.58699 type:complete len:221 (-) Transcript_15438:88-750(-)